MTDTHPKQSIQEQVEKLLIDRVYGFACKRCQIGGIDPETGEECQDCKGTGIVGWETTTLSDAQLALFLGAVTEAKPETKTAEWPLNDGMVGYNTALNEYEAALRGLIKGE